MSEPQETWRQMPCGARGLAVTRAIRLFPDGEEGAGGRAQREEGIVAQGGAGRGGQAGLGSREAQEEDDGHGAISLSGQWVVGQRGPVWGQAGICSPAGLIPLWQMLLTTACGSWSVSLDPHSGLGERARLVLTAVAPHPAAQGRGSKNQNNPKNPGEGLTRLGDCQGTGGVQVPGSGTPSMLSPPLGPRAPGKRQPGSKTGSRPVLAHTPLALSFCFPSAAVMPVSTTEHWCGRASPERSRSGLGHTHQCSVLLCVMLRISPGLHARPLVLSRAVSIYLGATPQCSGLPLGSGLMGHSWRDLRGP